MTKDEYTARAVKGWLLAARNNEQLSLLWDNLTPYSKSLDGVVALKCKLEKELIK